MPGAEQPIEPLEEAPDAADVRAKICPTLHGTGSNIDPRQCVLVQPDANFEIVFEAEDHCGAPDLNEAREVIRLEQPPAAAVLDEFHTRAPDPLERDDIGPADQPRVVGPRVGLGPTRGRRFGKSSCEQTASPRSDNKRWPIS